MSSFPPKRWQVRFLKDTATLACEAPDAGEIGMAAFLAVKPAGIEEGNFRFVLAGPSKLKVRFNIESQRQADKQQKESSNEKNKNDAPAVAKNVKTGTSKAAVSRVSHEIMWTIL